ncbi:hypothetical protein ACQP2X_35800 [Actinoplanes sp. CA-131856]
MKPYKLIVLIASAVMALTALAWVNQQHVRDLTPQRPARTEGF